MINLLVIACTILLIALIGTVIAAKKGWLADRDNDGFADVIEDKFDEVEDWVEDKVDDVKKQLKKSLEKNQVVNLKNK